ncbi:LOW QUALITY PROTEIN: DOK3 isoform 3 [Pongo abelii]|uniref:DOK3 isoform 3 n=1 Tax=Pongo abelii TaxID=9601 RepID=A0A2J8RDV7_PONAB|nr:LOW QUALITY PROTEIN: DOK3 isoform 3 [Pongo abelii]
MDPLETPIKDGILYQQHVKFGKGTGEASSGSTDAQSPKRGLVPMEENSIYSSWQEVGEFPVVVQRTEAATRCQLKGPALLVLGPDAIQLREAKGTQALYSWPYHFLRKFGSDKILLGTPGLSLLFKGERTDDVSGIILESLLRAYSVPGAGGHGRVQDSLGPVLREPTFQGERSFLKTSMLRSLCSCSCRHPRSQPCTQASYLQGSGCSAPHRNSTSAAHTLCTS